MTSNEQKLWLHFLWSFALSDHLGDASDAVRSLGEHLRLPLPDNDADFDAWLVWLRAQGIEEGINPPEAKRLA